MCYYIVVISKIIFFKRIFDCILFSGSNEELLARLKILMTKSKQETQELAIDHRVLHSTVSKVGKAIDRVCFYLF